jgi:hypothetical protein
VARFAEAVVPVENPEVTPLEVAHALDRFLASYHSRRKWRIKFVILGLELIPMVAGWPPMSLMSTEKRRAFVEAKLRGCRGLWGKVAMGKQLVLLAYYGLRRSEKRMGFVPFAHRERARRLLRAAPLAGRRNGR